MTNNINANQTDEWEVIESPNVTITACVDRPHWSMKEVGKINTMMTIKTPSRNNLSRNQGYNIILVNDNSRSMYQYLHQIKEILSVLHRHLDEADCLTLLEFSDKADIILPKTRMNRVGKKNLENIIHQENQIVMGNGTNLSVGIIKAFSLIKNIKNDKESECDDKNESHKDDDENNRQKTVMIILTDGNPNKGICYPEKLVQLVKENTLQSSQIGVQVSVCTVGIGNSDQNNDLLQMIADNGNGKYYSANKYQSNYLIDQCLPGVLVPIIKDATLTINLQPGVEWKDLMTSCPIISNISEIDSKISVNIGHLYYSDIFHFPFTLLVTDYGNKEGRQLLYRTELQFKNLEEDDGLVNIENSESLIPETSNINSTSSRVISSVEVSINRRSTMNSKNREISPSNLLLNYQIHRWITQRILTQSQELIESGGEDKAQNILQQQIRKIRFSVCYRSSVYRPLVSYLLELLQNQLQVINSGKKDIWNVCSPILKKKTCRRPQLSIIPPSPPRNIFANSPGNMLPPPPPKAQCLFKVPKSE